MKKIIVFAIMMLGALAGMAQGTRLSPQAAMLLSEVKNGKYSIDDLDSRYPFVKSHGETCVQAFAVLGEGCAAKALDAYGMTVCTRSGDMATVLIPVDRYAAVVAAGLYSYIDLGHRVEPLLDRVRADLGVDYIHNGTNLPQGYDGTGVVVGVIDIGFEYGHPTFYDSTGAVLRIKKVWQQTDTTGTAPAPYGYGRELTTTAEILAAATDNPADGHGSHVAGIAAGSGAPDTTGRRYRGMAPAADIVLVGCNMGEVGIMDGISYIHKYARSVGKPCVINISLGSSLGPHDGLSAFETQVASYLSGLDSIVVVVAAGNEGLSNQHLHHQFSATDTMIRTYCVDMNSNNYSTYFDCWGDTGSMFSLSVALVDHNVNTGVCTQIMSLPFVSSDVDSTYSFQLTYDSVYFCNISVVGTNPLNNRPNIRVHIHKTGRRESNVVFALTIKSTSANVHVWSNKSEFRSMYDNNFVQGDSDYTISGVAGNTDAVISVGSYATRTKRITDNGNIIDLSLSVEGDRSFFSSHGPTYDGRVKPDICATGEFLVSAINTPYIPSYEPDYLFDSTVFDGQTHYYCLMQGTSMSSPTAAGIVALWLQGNPALNVDSVRAILQATARTDIFTGDIPAGGDNRWGWGKIDAFGGLPATTVPMYQIDATPSNFMLGYVTGAGRHPQGQHTIMAHPATNYAFAGWDDGNSDNPRVIDLASDTTVVANFVFSYCDTIREFPWNAEFVESALNCWDTEKLIGVSPWMLLSGKMVSISMNGTIDNWLITPHVLAEAHTSLIYKVISREHDSLAILAITDQDTVLLADEYLTLATSGERAVGLNPFAGQVIRLAFRHHASTASGFVGLSDVKIDYYDGIDDVEAPSYRVATDGLRVTVAGAPDKPLDIHDAIGRRILTAPSANGTFAMPAPGVYILRVGNTAPRKVVLVR